MIWDYIFIGSGPATLAAVNFLGESAKHHSILVLEAGGGEGRKGCPGLKSNACSFCDADGCHVLNGVGGASAIFGNKMCHFPASSGISAFMEAADWVNFKGGDISDQHRADEGIVMPHPGSLNRKIYCSDIFFMDQYRALIGQLINKIYSFAELRSETFVERILPVNDDSGTFCVFTAAGDKFMARNVVIATGRSGHISLRKWLKELGIPYAENSADIGIRIEVDTHLITPGFLYQNDPKYKFDFGGMGSARTFCTCKGGHIIPVRYGDAFFADGAFLRHDTGRTNLALMARLNVPISHDAIEAWCADINRKAGGSLLLGEITANGISPDELVHEIYGLVPNWPTLEHGLLIEKLLRKVLGGEYVELVSTEAEQPVEFKVFGPSIDLYWPRPEIKKGFRTCVDGVWIIGDATGYSRGIVQAFSSGVSWARQQIEMDKSFAYGTLR